MCTTVAINGEALCFGRNMDLERDFGRVTNLPQNFPLPYRCVARQDDHYAILGMAQTVDGYPLFADGINEKGLAMAGLNFPGNAVYGVGAGEYTIAPFELIPWVLSQCRTVSEAKELLARTRLSDECFSRALPLSPMHWHIADREGSLVVEPMADGLKLYDAPMGVLANNPPFPWHMINLSRYAHLHESFVTQPGAQSLGESELGLPGDLSSPSRMVRAALLSAGLLAESESQRRVASAFQVMAAVAMPYGSVADDTGAFHYTAYASVMDGARLRYLWRRYGEVQTHEACMTQKGTEMTVYES